MAKERKEAWIRLPLGLAGKILLDLWGCLILVVGILHWIYVIFTGKRNKALAKFANLWVSYQYRFFRYMNFAVNDRPLGYIGLEMEPVDLAIKKKKAAAKKKKR